MINIRYAQIRSMDISNGEGIGVSLFVQGCHFHCHNCFNSDTWNFDGGKKWTQRTKEEFLNLVAKPYIKRVTVLGGEPLAEENVDEVFDLLADVKQQFSDKKIWLYTGYTWAELFDCQNRSRSRGDIFRKATILLCDVLVDGRYEDSLRDFNLKWRGSSNQRVIDVQKSINSLNDNLFFAE